MVRARALWLLVAMSAPTSAGAKANDDSRWRLRLDIEPTVVFFELF
jgi:hypothetical protein